jgi:hypothetical protein
MPLYIAQGRHQLIGADFRLQNRRGSRVGRVREAHAQGCLRCATARREQSSLLLACQPRSKDAIPDEQAASPTAYAHSSGCQER